MENEEQEYKQFATYIFRDNYGHLTTFTQPLVENDPEADAAPNMKFYVQMFVADSPVLSLERANRYIHQIQSQGLTEDEIKRINTPVKENSYLKFQDGTKINIIGVDEMRKMRNE
jgi:hypothetical protein